MGKPESQKIKKQLCIICGDIIKGYRAVGDNKIRDRNTKIIGIPYMIAGKIGYAHIYCKNQNEN